MLPHNQTVLLVPNIMETYHGYVETVLDALILFEACDLNMLTCVKRRLLGEERDHIRSGSVFIWDEDNSGIQRWTDGHRWSSSRPCGNFIVYDELDNHKRRSDVPKAENTTTDKSESSENDDKSASTGSSDTTNDTKTGATDNNNNNNTSSKRNVLSDGLVKRALSVCTADGRRLHLVSYYSKADIQRHALKIPRCDSALAAVKIPEAKFPEIICEVGSDGAKTWRFAAAQGRGHASVTPARFLASIYPRKVFPHGNVPHPNAAMSMPLAYPVHHHHHHHGGQQQQQPHHPHHPHYQHQHHQHRAGHLTPTSMEAYSARMMPPAHRYHPSMTSGHGHLQAEHLAAGGAPPTMSGCECPSCIPQWVSAPHGSSNAAPSDTPSSRGFGFNHGKPTPLPSTSPCPYPPHHGGSQSPIPALMSSSSSSASSSSSSLPGSRVEQPMMPTHSVSYPSSSSSSNYPPTPDHRHHSYPQRSSMEYHSSVYDHPRHSHPHPHHHHHHHHRTAASPIITQSYPSHQSSSTPTPHQSHSYPSSMSGHHAHSMTMEHGRKQLPHNLYSSPFDDMSSSIKLPSIVVPPISAAAAAVDPETPHWAPSPLKSRPMLIDSASAPRRHLPHPLDTLDRQSPPSLAHARAQRTSSSYRVHPYQPSTPRSTGPRPRHDSMNDAGRYSPSGNPATTPGALSNGRHSTSRSPSLPSPRKMNDGYYGMPTTSSSSTAITTSPM